MGVTWGSKIHSNRIAVRICLHTSLAYTLPVLHPFAPVNASPIISDYTFKSPIE